MSHKIYIGNLSYQTKENDIEELLNQFGEVVSVKIITDRETRRSKGFGFAELASADAMHQAISSLNGKDFMGRNLKVNEAQDKPRR